MFLPPLVAFACSVLVVGDDVTKLYSVKVATKYAHDHSREDQTGANGPPGWVRALLSSPSRVKLTPHDREDYLRRKGVVFDGDGVMKKGVESYVKRRKVTIQEENVGGASARGTYGGLRTYLEKIDKDYLIACGKFNEHTVYTLAPPIVDDVSHRVVVALSSDNLLLNAYRQQAVGVPSYIMVDTTHRLIVEGHNCMLIGTMDLEQHFHIIAYGICSHEDVTAHEEMLRVVKKAVEGVVAARMSAAASERVI